MSSATQCDKFSDKTKDEPISEHTLDQTASNSIIDEFGNSNVSMSSVDLQLRFQRILAESALDNTALDLTSDNGQFSKELTVGTSTPCFSNTFSGAFGATNKKDQMELEALFKKYYTEEFIPAENAVDRLLADEIAWKKEYDTLPPITDKLELSCFSGIMGDAEISLKSVADIGKTPRNKLKAEEYFSLKTDKMGSLEKMLSSKERPCFGNDIESPCLNRLRVAFTEDNVKSIPDNTDSTIEISSNEVSSQPTISSTPKKEVGLDETPCEESCSTLSVTSIEDILSKHLQDTPGTIARSILNSKTKKKTAISQDFTCSSSSTLGEQLSELLDNPVEKTKNEETACIQIQLPQSQFEVYVGSVIEVFVHIQNQSMRWLKCNMSLHKILFNNVENAAMQKEMSSLVHFPNFTSLDAMQKSIQKVLITPSLPGNFGIYININSEDAVAQISKTSIVKFDVSSKMPKVDVLVNGATVNEVDFGILPEMCSQLIDLEIRNHSEDNLPMMLNIEGVSNALQAFSLCKQDKSNGKTISEVGKEMNMLKVGVAFKAPNIKNCSDVCNGFVNFIAYLNIAIDFPGARTCLLKKLKLKGCVGVTQLLMNFESPVELTSTGPGVVTHKILKLKNGGVVPLNLELVVVDPITWQLDTTSVIIINNPSMQILPEEEASFTLSFTPAWAYEEVIKRKLVINVIPNGQLFEVNVQGKIDRNRTQETERFSCHSAGISSGSVVSSLASSSRSLTKMPIQTTHKQLVWTTIPVGKWETKFFRLRNDWSTSVKILLSIVDSSHCFSLLTENGEHVRERKLRLNPKDCVSIKVTFAPSKIGVAHGKIVIREAKRADSVERFAIPLNGYGGTFKLSIRNVSKDKTGNMWINLGPMDNYLQSRFTICNNGNLDAFIYVKYVPKGLEALLQDVNVKIQPSKTVISPGSREAIQVILENDLSLISKSRKDVVELGNIYVTCGDEPSRQRIRRINEMQRVNSTVNSVLELETICSTFLGETILSELKILNDPESAIRDLFRTLEQHEIVLTAERLDDQSIAMQTCIGNGHLGNQSLAFKSMLPDSTFLDSVEEESGKNLHSWSITPSTLTLLVPRFASGCITIASTIQEDQMFEITGCDDILSVEPSSGIVPKMGEVVVVVTCNVNPATASPNIKSTLKVYLENDMKNVTVHIKVSTEKSMDNKKSTGFQYSGERK